MNNFIPLEAVFPTGKWCVVFRTGTKNNFEWHRSKSMTRQDSDSLRISLMQEGFHALVVLHKQSLSIGLPETFQ